MDMSCGDPKWSYHCKEDSLYWRSSMRHPGATKMKALARSYVWWPKMDSEIEAAVKQCSVCQES